MENTKKIAISESLCSYFMHLALSLYLGPSFFVVLCWFLTVLSIEFRASYLQVLYYLSHTLGLSILVIFSVMVLCSA
jgi:hypothetical protein